MAVANGGNGGGGGGGGDEGRPRWSALQIVLQLAVAYFLYSRLSGAGGLLGGGDTKAGAAATAVVTATPTPSPPPSGQGGSLFDMLSGKGFGKKVAAGMEEYEAARAAALTAVTPGTTLRNLWRPGVEFDVAIYLATSADVIDDTSALTAMQPWGIEEGVGDAQAGGAQAGSGVPGWSHLLSTHANLYDMIAAVPGVTYPNTTFAHVVTCQPRSPTPQSWDDGGHGGEEVDGQGGADEFGSRQHAPPLPAVIQPQQQWPSGCVHTGSQPPRPLWWVGGFRYVAASSLLPVAGGDTNYRLQHVNITLPREVSANRTGLYAHVYLIQRGVRDNRGDLPRAFAAGAASVVPTIHRIVYPLRVLLAKKPVKRTVNLLGGEEEDSGANTTTTRKQAAWGIGAAQPTATAPPVPHGDGPGADAGDPGEQGASGSHLPKPYWRPALHVQLVMDHSGLSAKAVPPHLANVLWAVPDAGGYLPPTHVNDFWLLGHQLIPLNDTVTTVPLTVSVSVQPMWQWAVQSQMSASWEMQAAMGTASEGETDMLKSILLETNPILLAITIVVSTLHTLFDFLAFKNDISFWRSTKTLEGLSVRSIAVNTFFQGVILLYLWDNDTSWLVLGSSAVGFLIEVWKLRKAVAVNMTWEGGWPRLQWQDKEATYAASRTKEYDDIATNHMLFILYPVVVGYALHSLFFHRHRSWYSWILNSLTGFVYVFGFIQMVPQLYINYRMKSVAHLPWRVMVYKSLNTFVDDLFAWVIKMPTLHRIAVFRDDIIFLIFLYQRWIYPVDRTRKNEFGASAADYEHAAARAAGQRRGPARSKWDRRP